MIFFVCIDIARRSHGHVNKAKTRQDDKKMEVDKD